MEAGRGVVEGLLGSMDVPYYVAAPLLLQDMASGGSRASQDYSRSCSTRSSWMVPFAVVLGALEGDDIVLEQERVTKLWACLETHEITEHARARPKGRTRALRLPRPTLAPAGTAA